MRILCSLEHHQTNIVALFWDFSCYVFTDPAENGPALLCARLHRGRIVGARTLEEPRLLYSAGRVLLLRETFC
jgi:hypothetical protein